MLHIDLKYTHLISCHLERFTRKGDYLFNFRCPICGDSQTKKTKTRGYIYRDKQRLAFKCWNGCAPLWLGALIKHLSVDLYKEYLLETFVDNHTPRTKKLIGEPGFFAGKATVTQQMRFGTVEAVIYEHAEKVSDLPEEHFCSQYVKSRQIPKQFWGKLYYAKNYNKFISEIAPHYDKKIKDEPRLCIMVYDQFGAVCAVSGRALEDSALRYVTIRTTTDESKLVYGLERVDQNKPVQIVEGPLDSLFLGNTVASCDSNLILTAGRLSATQIVLLYDNERRSPEIVLQMTRAINLGHKVVVWPEWLVEKDINGMVLSGHSPESIQEIIYRNTFTGLTALAELTRWKKTPNNRRVMLWMK